MQIGNWHFEEARIKCRRVKNYGDKYNGVTDIVIVDGEPHVEGLLSTIGFTQEDVESLAKYIRSLGYSYYVSSSFVKGERVTKKIKI